MAEVRLRMARGKRTELELQRLGYTDSDASTIERLKATARCMGSLSVRKTTAALQLWR